MCEGLRRTESVVDLIDSEVDHYCNVTDPSPNPSSLHDVEKGGDE